MMPDDSSGAKAEAQKKAGRGVSYPVMGLEDAIDKARTFYREERQSAAPVAAAMKHFGYSETSSGGRQVIATLIQYGLLQDEGRSDNRSLKLTERALAILLDEQESPERLQAIKECALMPRLYGIILAKYPVDIPSDHSLGFFLQREFDFNPKTLKAFIKDFRDTMAFADVRGAPKMPVVAPALAPSKPAADVVDGIQASLTMTNATLTEQAPPLAQPAPAPAIYRPALGEEQLAHGKLGKGGVSYRLLTTGKVGSKELGKIIKLLQAQQAEFEDDDESGDDAIFR